MADLCYNRLSNSRPTTPETGDSVVTSPDPGQKEEEEKKKKKKKKTSSTSSILAETMDQQASSV